MRLGVCDRLQKGQTWKNTDGEKGSWERARGSKGPRERQLEKGERHRERRAKRDLTRKWRYAKGKEEKRAWERGRRLNRKRVSSGREGMTQKEPKGRAKQTPCESAKADSRKKVGISGQPRNSPMCAHQAHWILYSYTIECGHTSYIVVNIPLLHNHTRTCDIHLPHSP